MAGIFISYRRTQEPSAFARLVSDRLGGAFPGAPIFLDVATIDAGHDWQAAIKKALADAETLLALIDEKWLTAADEHGRRRLDLPDDYVCFEIASALSAGKRVIPVLIGKASIPIPAALPTSIADLTKRQAMRLTHEGFDSEIGRLIETLGGDPTTSATVPAQSPQPPDLPHATNPYFTGRDEDLAQLHTSLRATGKAVRVQVVAAMGGVGKTTLANEYAHKHWQDYQQVLWVDARRGYEAEFALAFDRLFPERATADILPAAKAKAALAELNSPTDRLLVIDNAEDDKSVQPWLPHGATGCRTLITSRFTAWPKAAGVKVIDLGVLAPEKARDFLIERTGRTNEADACAALAKELGYLPLALEQAGAYIDEVSVSIDTYRRLLSKAAETVLGRPAPGSTQYSDPVLATWRTTIDKLAPESRAILRLCAWYADTPIPTALILNGADDVLAVAAKFGEVTPRPESDAATEARLREAIGGLKRYSMILDVTDESFRLHGLVQAVERLQAAKDGYAVDERGQALERLTSIFPHALRDISQWPLCRQLMPHQQTLIGHLESAFTNATLADLWDRIGSFLQGAGDRKGALAFFQRALEARERLFGRDHGMTLASINNLGSCFEMLGDAKAALPLFRRALEGCEQLVGVDHPNTLTCLNNLAGCLAVLEGPEVALPLHQRALNGYERKFDGDHPETLRSVKYVATCQLMLGDAKAALPLFRRVLNGRERQLGTDHIDTLLSANDLAHCLQALDDVNAALPFFRRAAVVAERILGAEHPWTRTFKSNLTDCEAKLRGQS